MSSRTRSWVMLGAAVAIVGFAALLASGRAATRASLGDRVHEVAAGLRCPVCMNLSVADSPSNLAGEMRSEIESQLRAGRSPEQVRAFFVERYGEWILLEPTRRGLNLLPWLVPVAGLLIGIGIWVAFVRARATPLERDLTSLERERIEHDLAHLEEPG